MTTRHPLIKAVLMAGAVIPWLGSEAHGQAHAEPVPRAYRLDLTVVPERARFDGHVEIDVDLAVAASSIALDGRDLTVTRALVRQNGAELRASYRQIDRQGHARLDLTQAAAAGRATLVLDYNAAFGDSVGGLYRARIAGRWYVWSHMETKDARRVFPGFDRPGYKTPFILSVATAPGLTVAGNAAEASTGQDGPLIWHRFYATAPLPTYLVAVAVGPFAVSKAVIAPDAVRTAPVPLRILSTQDAGSAELASTQTGPILAQLEAYMGRPYPYSKLDEIGSPLMIGGMENAAAIVYAQDVLVPHDRGSANEREFGREVSHELAHQWFGDLVSPRSWDDLWLNESFANWMSYRIGDRWRPDLRIGAQLTEEAVGAMQADELAASHPVHQLTGSEGDPFFDEITYGKGAQVLGMFEAYMGEAGFREGLQGYLRQYANGSATTDEFFASLAGAVGDPRLLTSLRAFVDQPGVPVLRFERSGTGYRVTQRRYAQLGDTVPGEHWAIPLCYRTDAVRSCVLLDEATAEIPVAAAGVVMPNAGGSGYYRFSLPAPEWQALIASGPTLSPAEALMITDSLWADFYAGEVAPSLLVEAARRLAINPFGPASIDSANRLATLRRRGLLPPGQRAAYDRLIGSIYRPILDRIGFAADAETRPEDTPERQQLRTGLEKLLAQEAEDQVVLARLAQAAERDLRGERGAIAPALQLTAYAAYIGRDPANRMPALFDRLLKETDANEREVITYALGSGRDGAGGGWLLRHAADVRLSKLDRTHLLFALAEEPATREATLIWAAGHLELLSDQGVSALTIRLAENSCSLQDERFWARALGGRVAGDPAARLMLSVTLEKVRNCAALRTRSGKALEKLLNHGA